MVLPQALDGLPCRDGRPARRLQPDRHARPERRGDAQSGVYLEVVPNRRLVFTDAFTSAWVPSAKPFMVAIVEFEDLGDGTTRYTATVRHWTVEDRQAHEQMGFHQGWGVVADQLAEVAKTF